MISYLIAGIYGLKYFSQIAHAPKPKTATNPINSRKLTIFGGKGGVGKCVTLCLTQIDNQDSLP